MLPCAWRQRNQLVLILAHNYHNHWKYLLFLLFYKQYYFYPRLFATMIIGQPSWWAKPTSWAVLPTSWAVLRLLHVLVLLCAMCTSVLSTGCIGHTSTGGPM